jgi:ubiquinone/menaquinone biosynthesis C-methylase UbiE
MSQWYEESFGEDYLVVYRHRSKISAQNEVRAITRWLDMKPGQHVLDLCCGTGRHSIALADEGMHVTGIDLSETLLKRAKEDSAGRDIRYVHGDMRELPFADGTFDVVVNLFTSFGYFETDADNRKVLEEMARVLRTDGAFLIDFLNRQSVQIRLVPVSEREQNGLHIREERCIDGDFVRKTITITTPDGKQRQYHERVKMYTFEQMRDMLEQSGLRVEDAKGDFEGNPYTPESPRMILMGRGVR